MQVWGGEPTVRLPDQPGRGGRNQHLALRCATAIQGREGLAILCAATDGADGSGEDAGALVDGDSVQRGRDAGMDPEACLERADSGSFLEAAGDLIFTGPTSTNVNDIVIGVRGYTG
jgi:glycerate 2-kinase